ncbi:MAG: TetR family transcriptional regulator [Pseudomonadota bacterium]
MTSAPKASSAPKARRSRAEQRAETRGRMLQAALDLIIEEGIRSVRHRAVARRAGVALGSTTYHFDSIEELIVSAFQYWRERALLVENPFYLRTGELLADYNGSVIPQAERALVGAKIHAISVGYMESQLSGKREDRLLELAFHHESVRYPALKELVMEEWQAQHDYLATVHHALGSAQPSVDARLTVALFRQIEQWVVIGDVEKPDMELANRLLHRHLSLCIGAELPALDQ